MWRTLNLPRTPLYGLPLAGANTGDVESLSSYLQRLAAAHHMNPRTFSSQFFKIRGNRREEALHFNGVGAVASRFSELVESNTGVNVRAASMARFGAVVPTPYLVRQVHSAYCPKCVLLTNQFGRAYSRLAWELEFVTACPIHGLKLQLRRCGALPNERLNFAQKPTLPDVCRDCGSVGLLCQGVLEPAMLAEQWIANQAADLVSLSDSEVNTFSLDRLREGIASAVAYRFDGQPVKAARAAGLARATVLTWLQGESRPALGALFRFAIHAQASVVELFRGKFREAICTGRSAPHKIRFRRKNWGSIRQALSREIASETPASLQSFAVKYEVDSRQLRRTLPIESSTLIEKSAAFRLLGARILHQRWFSEFTKAALALRQEGKTVCRKNLEARSGIACFKSSRARYRVVMRVLQQFQA